MIFTKIVGYLLPPYIYHLLSVPTSFTMLICLQPNFWLNNLQINFSNRYIYYNHIHVEYYIYYINLKVEFLHFLSAYNFNNSLKLLKSRRFVYFKLK